VYPPAVADRYPDRVAYIMAGSGQTLTYSQLDRASNRLAHLFRQHGIGTGDTVALVLENRIEWPVVVAAGMRAGLYVTPLNWHLKPAELAQLLADARQQGRWAVDRVDLTDTASVRAAVTGADLLWLETPSNPLLDIADLPALCAAGRDAGALVGVDNTFATPLLQQPLALGADVVVHSATKFIGGHSDLLSGITIAREQALAQRLRHRRGLTGATPGALEAFLALRGLRTLALRLDRGQRNAGELARRLDEHPAVSRVRYPGLPGDPGHRTAAAQMTGFGAVLAFEVADAPTADRLCDALAVIVHATSLGGVETTIERRSKLAGQGHLPAGLLRLSVGCEHIKDLWNDLDSALQQAGRITSAAAPAETGLPTSGPPGRRR